MPKSGHAALAYGVVAQADKHEHNCTNANAQNCLINTALGLRIKYDRGPLVVKVRETTCPIIG